MESPVVRSRGRPRKRKREETEMDEDGKVDVKDVVMEDKNDVQINARKRGRPPKKKPVEIQGQAMVGCYVLKEFEGSGIFLGKVVSYDTGLYRVDYEDGDFEDLDSAELREYLIADERREFVGQLLERKIQLDDNLEKKTSLKSKIKGGNQGLVGPPLDNGDVAKPIDKGGQRVAGCVQSDLGNSEVGISSGEVDGSEVDDDDDDDDSSSDSCEYGQGWEMRSETEISIFPPPELPPSSGNIGIPEEYVPNLFSVYGFLRSFSVRLFLSPFTLDDLVGCLNCTVPNTLLDAVHVALLRPLRRHLETLASDGTELASKCLRCIDWGLLDNLTWPVYLVHYLMVMDRLNGHEWKVFYADVLEKDYCTLSVGTKLMVLQILCDDALDTEEIRAEMDMREESEVGEDSEVITNALENGPRKMYPKYSKHSAGKGSEMMNINAVKGNDHGGNTANMDEDGNGDECRLCGMDGVLLCCDGCPSAYHPRCIGVSKLSIPEGEWFCPECTMSRIGPSITVGTSLKGAEVFGIDSYAQLFMGTCNHLVVLKVSLRASAFARYYNRDDIPKVVSALCSSPHHGASYLGICWAILKYWELPQVLLRPFTNNHLSFALENREGNALPTHMHPSGENKSQDVVMENYVSSLGEIIVENGSVSGTEKLGLRVHSTDISLGVPIQSELTAVPREVGPTMDHNLTSITSKPSEHAMVSCAALGSVDGLSVTGIASPSSVTNCCRSPGHRSGMCLPDNIYAHRKLDGKRFAGRTDQKWKDTCLYLGSHFKPLAYINQYAHGEFAASAAASFAVLSSDESRPAEVNGSDPRKVMSANVGLQGKAFSSVAVRFFWPSTEKKLVEVPRERCSWCLHCKAPITSKKACLLNQAASNVTKAAMKFVLGLRLSKNIENCLYGIAAYTLYMEESLHGLILGPFRSASYRQQWRRKVEQASSCCDMKSLLLELEENLCTNALSSEWTKLVDNWMDEPSVLQTACATGTAQKRGPGRRKKQFASTEAAIDDSNDGPNDVNWWRGGKLAKLVFRRGTLPRSVITKAARQGGSRRIPGISYADGPEVPKRSRQFIWRAAVEMARNVSQLALQVRYLDHHIKWGDLVRPEQNVQDAKGPETDLFAFRNAHICDKKLVMDNKIIYGVTFGHQKHLSSRLMKSVIEKEESQGGRDKYWFSEIRVPLYLIKEYEENTDKSHMPSVHKPDPLSKLQKRQLKASREDIFCYLARKRENLYMCLCASCHQDVLLGVAVKCSACEGYCHKSCTMSSTVITNEDFEYVTTCKLCSHGKVVTQASSTVESPTSPLTMQGQEYQNSATVSKNVRLRSATQQYQNAAVGSKSLRPKSDNQQSPSVGAVEVSDKKQVSSDSNLKKSQKKDRQCHWGLIWKKKNTDDGTDFRLKNVLLRGSPSVGSMLEPECYICHKEYSHDLTYIHCENCQHWYHADALELDESKLSNLIGFKCCRCRRIKSPKCPYDDRNPKKAEAVKKIRIKGPKQEGVGANPVSVFFSEQTESSVPSTPVSPMEEVYIQVDDPLLLSVSEGEYMPEPKTEADFEWNTPMPAPQKLPVRRQDDPLLLSVPEGEYMPEPKSEADFEWNTTPMPAPQKLPVRRLDDPLLLSVPEGEYMPKPKTEADFEWNTTCMPAPQKLPVRRHTKNEKDDGGFAWNEDSLVQEPASIDDWHVSNDGLEDGATFDYDNLSYGSAEFEPQTYFSFTELLEADNGEQLGAVEASGVDWQDLPCENSQTGFMEQCGMVSTNEHLTPASVEPVQYAQGQCIKCSETALPPDLCCRNCGLQIHSHCSPWEAASQGETWSCGNCKEWR